MTLPEYQDGYINVEAISRLYIRELNNAFEKDIRYELILITMDGHVYSCFTGDRESCKQELAEIISIIGAKAV